MSVSELRLGGKHEECHTCGCQGHECCCQSMIQMIPDAHQEDCGNKVWDELAADGPLLPALSDPNWKPAKCWWEFWR